MAYTFTVTNNISLTARFNIKAYSVSVSAQDGGTVSGGGNVNHGSSMTVTASPSAYYNFSGWYSGGVLVSSNLSYTFTVTSDVNLQARFTLRPGAPGSVVHVPMSCVPWDSPDAGFIKIKHSDYGRAPISVTILYFSTGNRIMDTPITVGCPTSGGQTNAINIYTGKIANITCNDGYKNVIRCYIANYKYNADPSEFIYTFFLSSIAINEPYCKEYKINF